jgi:hypothetical protein
MRPGPNEGERDRTYINKDTSEPFSVFSYRSCKSRRNAVMRNERLRKDEVRDAGKQHHQTIQGDRPRSAVIFADPSSREGRKRKPKQEMQVRPEDWPINALGSVQEMVVVVPVDAGVNEAQDVAQKDRNRGSKCFERRTGGHLRSRTIIVMMIAKTPSLKASRRPLFIEAIGHVAGGA